ncbi:ABC transporter permease [Streptomyces sp. NBC_00932]|uniref:ABC transporter permease n=1 Tax=Streptomyces sp. NBC_00932 TaxID=2903690 RepID=UPI0038653C51|nr:ABC transporter permease [Streptomyces sp. NBC_00932]
MSTLHQNTVTDPGTPAGTNAGTDAGTGSQRLRGPYWVAARTHRSTLQGAAGLLVLAVLLLTAIRVWGGGLAGGYWTDTRIVENAASVIALLPYLIAAFVAGPVVARELESGTHQLLWTQSVSPVRWFAAKLAVPTALALVGSVVLDGLYRWVWSTSRHEDVALNWYSDSVYHAIGPIGIATALLVVPLGALTGLLIRRTVPAIVTSLIATAAVSSVLEAVRGHLWPVVTVRTSLATGYPAMNGMVTGEGAVTTSGAHVADPICVDDKQCQAAHHLAGYFRSSHPVSHFWPLQLVETGILLALAAVLALVVFRVVKRMAV